MKYRIDIVIDLDEIQQAIYTEGVWHPAENATAWGVNSSNVGFGIPQKSPDTPNGARALS